MNRASARGRTLRRLGIGEVLLMLAVVALVAGGIVADARYREHQRTERRDLRLATFDAAWETIRDKHFDPALGGVDWAAARTELRPRMAAAASRNEARELLRQLLGRLGQSHAALLPAEALTARTYASEAGSAGLDLVLLDGRAIVRRVAHGSPAEGAGILPGWELLRVDDEDIEDLVARLARDLPESSGRRMAITDAAARPLHGAVGSTRRLVLADGHDAQVERTLVLAPPPGHLAQVGNLPAGYVQMEVRRLPEGFLAVALDAFIEPAYVLRRFNQAMESSSTAPGLVLDLRGNGGGLSEMVTAMLGWLTAEPLTIGRMITRRGALPVRVQARPSSYAGPVAVLVDERCVSGAELFAEAARRLPRARLFGVRTAGAVQGGLVERLPDGDALMYPYSDFRTPDDRPLEGIGVPPDEVVEPTRSDLLAGRDPVLAAARAWLATQAPPTAPARRRRTADAVPPAPGAPAHIDPKAAAVLDAYVEATGGITAWRALRSRVVHATVRLGARDGFGIALDRTTYQARPDRSLTVESSDYMGEGRAGTVGAFAWESGLFRGTQPLGPARARALRRATDLDGPASWRTGLRRAEERGIDRVEDRPAHHLVLETDWGLAEEHWYDAESHLLVRMLSTPPTGDEMPLDLSFSDYRWSGGVRLPFRIRAHGFGGESTLTVDRVDNDVELADDLFQPPAGLRPAADALDGR